MNPEQIARLLEEQLGPEELARIEAMPPEDKKEFQEYFVAHLKSVFERTNKKAEEIKRTAVEGGVNVEGSKGVQFLIGCIAGLSVRIDDLEKGMTGRMR